MSTRSKSSKNGPTQRPLTSDKERSMAHSAPLTNPVRALQLKGMLVIGLIISLWFLVKVAESCACGAGRLCRARGKAADLDWMADPA